MKHIVIIGGGVAAFESAVAARLQAPEAEVTMFSKEDILPYRRPGLSALAAGDEPVPDSFFIKSARFYGQNRINVKTGVVAESVDPQKSTVTFSGLPDLKYDRLIIATGGNARKIPVPGADNANTFTLRDYNDLLTVRRMLSGGGKRVAVIGGGLLGLELADSLLKRGCQVTVIEGASSFLPRNLDFDGGRFALEKAMKNDGLKIMLGKSVMEITPCGVVCSDCFVECDLVAFSTGVVPCFPTIPGIAVNRGIIVDSSMKSNIDNIYACGDVAEYNGNVCGLYITASQMGKVAGSCAAGGSAVYVPEAVPARLNALGLKIFSAGNISGNSASEEFRDEESYRKIFVDEAGNVTGAVFIGDISRSTAILKQLKK